jgi:hypothetical protein
MLRLATDEDFDNDVVRGLLREEPNLGIMRVQDAGLSGKADSVLLEWAEREGRIMLTHDISTMTKYAFERIGAGERVAGVLVVRRGAAFATVISDILLFVIAIEPAEAENQIRYIPL